MTTIEIIELIVLIVVVVGLSIYYLVKAIKNGWIKKLTDTIETSIKEAEEKYPETSSGDKKKEYVIGKVKAKCNELGIPYGLLYSLISKLIDTIISNYNVISK